MGDPLPTGWVIGSGKKKKKSMLPFAWGFWNCPLLEIHELEVGTERGQTLERKSHLHSLNRRDARVGRNSGDQVDRGRSKSHSFPRRGSS